MREDQSHSALLGVSIPLLAILAALAPLLHEAVAGEFITIRAVSGPWHARSVAFGKVRARADSPIVLPFAVRVTSTEAAPGKIVAAGAVLLGFDAPALQEAVGAYASARRNLTASSRRLALLSVNQEQHLATRTDVAAAEQDLERVRGQADAAWTHLRGIFVTTGARWTRSQIDARLDSGDAAAWSGLSGVLRAPFAGMVVTRVPAVGAWVEAHRPVMELEDLTEVYVTVGVPQGALDKWRGGEARIQDGAASIPLNLLPGAAGMDSSSGLRLLRYRAVNAEGHLGDGQWVRVVHRSAAQSVSWVPAAAVARRGGKAWCLVMEAGGPHPVPVRVGRQQAGRIPVLEGLEAGEEVVAEGAYELLYGDLKQLVKFVD